MASPKTLSRLERFRRWFRTEDSFNRRLLAATLIGFLAILVLGLVFLFVAVLSTQRDSDRTRMLEVARLARQIEKSLALLEVSRDAHLLTRQPQWLQRLEASRASLPPQLARLSELLPERTGGVTDEVQAEVDQWSAAVSAAAKAGPESSSPGSLPSLDRARELIGGVAGNSRDALEETTAGSAASSLYEVLIFTPRLETAVAGMARSVWNYALTGSPEALQTFRASREDFYACHGYLSVLTEDRPEPTAQLAAIKDSVEHWQRQFATAVIQARQSGGDAIALIAAGNGPQAIEKSLGQVRALEEAEQSRFDSLSLRTRLVDAGKTTGLAVVCLSALAVLAASSAYSFLAFRKHLRKIESSEVGTRAIVASTMDGVITMNRQGLVLSMNPGAEEMFARPAHQVLGKSIATIIPQRLFVHDMGEVERGTIVAMGQRQNYYPFPIEISFNQVTHGEHQTYVALIRDVSARNRADETLKSIGLGVTASTGEEFIRSMIKELCKALKTDFAFIVQVTRRGAEITSSLLLAEGDQIRSRPAQNLKGTFFDEVIRKGYSAFPAAVCETYPADTLLAELSAQGCAAMPLLDHLGVTVGVMGVIHGKPMNDLAIAESTLRIFAARAGSELERKRFEEDLAAEKERLAVTLRSIGDGCITVDQEGRVLLINSVAEKLTGWTQAQADGQPLTQVFRLIDNRTLQPMTGALEKLITSGSPSGLEGSAIVVALDGSERAVESSAAPIRDRSNRRIGVVLVFRDVTDKIKVEEERRKAEKLESLGVAAGGIAHDFNNLLTSIIGNISLALIATRPGEGISERLNTAKKSSIRAQELSHQLLTFAKGGAPIKTAASIGQIVRDSVTFSLHGTRTKPHFDLPENLWSVEFDSSQISQVLTNVTINADQAMPSGGPLWIACANCEVGEEEAERTGLAAGDYVRIELRDEGAGIPAKNLEKIFDPYFSTRPNASGLGLATSYSIVAQHEGRIDIASTPGEGATVTILLPASRREAAAAPEAVLDRRPGTNRILVLDDEEDICALVTLALTQVGFEVVETLEPEAAIRAYREAMDAGRPFDAVISDLTIPGSMGGQEAVRRLNEIDPGVRAIVSSGYAMDPVMSKYREHGFCACLAKPYEVSALQKLVQEVVGGNSGISIVRQFEETAGV